ncbi:serine palmitoyltransferase subunit [Echinococcus multilocularis]|uniref:Serine palmitoyltransferase 1 n=1 Tax=Echinococcus multilocularis TaxID=6211 RepID=A0A087VZH1_ECHMU|nr:serine palmitoyltransferase subunit [Echinococcus multilocularis]
MGKQEDQFSEYTWPRLIYSALRVPAYHLYFEICLIIGIIWLLFKRSYNIHDKVKLSAAEKEELIKEWIPEPLVPASWTPPKKILERFHRASVGPIGKYVQFEGESGEVTPPHLNVASLNFLDFIGDEKLNKVAIEALRTYGLGACGPRGFYGTFDVHLTLEKAIESFLGVEEVVLYSYAFSTIASAIPAYAKRTDLIFADEGVSQAIQEGLRASRSAIRYFRHNDINHLEELLIAQEAEDSNDLSRASQTRRFLVVEGLYLDYGDICPLPQLVDLKYKYKVRIILDESISFGVLGKAGRGVTEHFGINVEHVDVITSPYFFRICEIEGRVNLHFLLVGRDFLSSPSFCLYQDMQSGHLSV